MNNGRKDKECNKNIAADKRKDERQVERIILSYFVITGKHHYLVMAYKRLAQANWLIPIKNNPNTNQTTQPKS